MRPLTTTLAAVAGTAVAVAAFGSFGVPDAKAASRPSCKLVSPREIKAVLGFKVPKPRVTRNGPVTVCQYGNSGKTALIRFQTGESRSTFRGDRAQFNAEHEPTKTFTGLGLPAFSSAIPGFPIYTIVVLKGHTTLLVTANAPLAKIAKLVRKILPKM